MPLNSPAGRRLRFGMPPCRAMLFAAIVMAVGLSTPLFAAPSTFPARVDVILWFDTEDYLLPADDDATKRLCEMLTQRHIRATFKIVGEKARVLERRGRRDVLAALRKHDIGYHSDFHSVHPTPTEYLADAGWREGVAEFVRRERDGAADVRRILGVKTLACYGQPGSSWAPQTLAALPFIGVAPHGTPCYVDEGSHVGVGSQPFWYAGALNVFHMSPNYTRMELHDPDAVAPAKQKVTEIAERLRASGGGLISIFYHPCEWVHREFWDGVNFKRGANPPREQWKAPPQRSAEETEAAFARFGEYVDHIRQIPGVHWVTASDLPLRYPDLTRTKGATREEISELAARLLNQSDALNFQRVGNKVFSLADQFELLALALTPSTANSRIKFPIETTGLLGPDAAAPVSTNAQGIAPLAFRDALRDVQSFIRFEHRVPSRVFIGGEAIAPADFLIAMAAAWQKAEQGVPLREPVMAGNGARVLPEKHVAADTPQLFGAWVIHREGFRAPKLMELARLQAWTLKPAICSGAE